MRYQGKYRPTFPKKYKGDYHNIIYRSSWEYKFMVWCDRSSSVTEWGSEEIIVPYTSPADGRRHRYFPDFYLKIGRKKYMVEVKPLNQTKEPKKQNRNTKRYITEVVTYAINQAKWKAAREYCKDRGWQFMLITEKELKV
tara:strand:- start:9421 stop:9840 length:420 start_codon:yes stop_codon:yes gene_type:complete